MDKMKIRREIRRATQAYHAFLEAHFALMGTPPVGTATPKSKPRKEEEEEANRASGDKRSPDEVEVVANRLLKAIFANPGLRIEELADLLGVPSRTLKLPARKLVQAKKVKTTGERRGTRYKARAGVSPFKR